MVQPPAVVYCLLLVFCLYERESENLKYIDISLDSEKKMTEKTGTHRNRNQGMHKCKKGPCIAWKEPRCIFSLPLFEFRIHIPVPFLVMTSHDSLDFPNFDFLWMYLKIRDLQNPTRKIMCWDLRWDMLHIKFTWNLRTKLWVVWFHEGDYDYTILLYSLNRDCYTHHFWGMRPRINQYSIVMMDGICTRSRPIQFWWTMRIARAIRSAVMVLFRRIVEDEQGRHLSGKLVIHNILWWRLNMIVFRICEYNMVYSLYAVRFI